MSPFSAMAGSMPKTHELMTNFAEMVATPTMEQQLVREVLEAEWLKQKGWKSQFPIYVQLHCFQQAWALATERFVWLYWPGVTLHPRSSQACGKDGAIVSTSHFNDVIQLATVDTFSRRMYIDEVLKLRVWWVFLRVAKGNARFATRLEALFTQRLTRPVPSVQYRSAQIQEVVHGFLMLVQYRLVGDSDSDSDSESD